MDTKLENDLFYKQILKLMDNHPKGVGECPNCHDVLDVKNTPTLLKCSCGCLAIDSFLGGLENLRIVYISPKVKFNCRK